MTTIQIKRTLAQNLVEKIGVSNKRPDGVRHGQISIELRMRRLPCVAARVLCDSRRHRADCSQLVVGARRVSPGRISRLRWNANAMQYLWQRVEAVLVQLES